VADETTQDGQQGQDGAELSEQEQQQPEQPTPQAEESQPVAAAAEEPAVAAEQPVEAAEQSTADADASVEESAESSAEAAEEPAQAAEQPPATPEQAPALVELASEARYIATGKRKSSVARVILRPGSGGFELNGKPLETYFPRSRHQAVVRQPLDATGYLERVDVRARIHGGGVSGQADAVRHGIAKALIEVDPNLRGELKRRQFLTRDPRVKERRKAGLKKARKRPQFSKR